MDHKVNKMLIDATHPEETRVVVLRNGRVEEFDFESAKRAQLRGNIYLAKVTRVEPSLQAAFVEYGGNRHGFLAFSEIHPDYYQIPLADKQALLEEEARAEAEADAEADARAERRSSRGERRGREHQHAERRSGSGEENFDIAGAVDAQPDAADAMDELDADGQSIAAQRHEPVMVELPPPEDATDQSFPDAPDVLLTSEPTDDFHVAGASDGDGEENGELAAHIEEVVESQDEPEVIETDIGDEADDEGGQDAQERPRRARRRSYKIQEVIKRRQVILVQVVKEERGNKGAALTTYLSLAGRYTVLMPNTGRGGGISRKITNASDRKRLKAIAQELDVPEGMGLIIRTAGAARTNQEIKRDYEYLLRLWESVRELTLQSTAPCLVYEEGNVIKRSIRDLYSKEIDEIVVAGDTAYREASEFMGMLMPSHTRNVVRHSGPEALFARYQIERQLNAFFSPQVTLRSGGYIVINQTEALVAIDVNSGKSTREYSIEETALNTNLEAADEIARQLKLRDLAGLIVVDFIDMEEKRNNRAVERRLKEALRFDRARIQVGRISHFGLLEMSRQRMRPGMLEGSTSQCPHCQGTGMIRSTESVALAVLRGLEDHLNRDGRHSVTVLTTAMVALYILNNKRQFIIDIEDRFGVGVAVQASERMHGANYSIERSLQAVAPARRQSARAAVNMDWGFEAEPSEDAEAHADYGDAQATDVGEDRRPSRETAEREMDADAPVDDGDEGSRRRRRRRRRGRDRDRDREERPGQDVLEQVNGHDESDIAEIRADDAVMTDGETGEVVSSPPGRSGGRRGEPRARHADATVSTVDGDEPLSVRDAGSYQEESGEETSENGDGERRRRRRRRGRRSGRRPRDGEVQLAEDAADDADGDRQEAEELVAETDVKEDHQVKAAAVEPIAHVGVGQSDLADETESASSVENGESDDERIPINELPAVQDDPAQPVRRGWWQRRILGQ